jgi:hypothetical protein
MTATVEELSEAVAHLDPTDLERLSTSVLERLQNRGKAGEHFQEAVLLLGIHETLNNALWERYAVLIARRRAETLTEVEYTELRQLTQEVEAQDARRLELLAQLARLRRQPLKQLIESLNLPMRDI